MPICRIKPPVDLVSEDLLNGIKSIRPLRLFINKQKKKGVVDKPFNLRVKFCKLSAEKQAKFLHKSVDHYIQLLDERDVDESVQIECRLFDYLLTKNEQKKYFQAINAPNKPSGISALFDNQDVKSELDDNDSDTSRKSLPIDEQRTYRKRRKEVNREYEAQVRNFSNDLPDRLRTDYLLYAKLTPLPHPLSQTQSIRQRRKSLTVLPESLQTDPIVDVNRAKLNRSELDDLHQYLPHELYYEQELNNSHKRKFQTRHSKNAHSRALFNRLSSDKRLTYILKSIEQWKIFLKSNSHIVRNQIPTLHLLLPKNEEILLYFSSIGLPQRPPLNSYIFYQLEHSSSSSSSDQTWSLLTEQQRQEYTQNLRQLKNDYYKQLITFVEQKLTNDYLRYEFFRNIKYAIRDYELALKTHSKESCLSSTKDYERKLLFNHDRRQFQQIKQKLLQTKLTNEQKNLVEELSDLLSKYIE